MSGLVGFSGTQNEGRSAVTHQESMYLQAVGEFHEQPYGQFHEQPYGQALEYPNREGSPQYSGYGSLGAVTSHEPSWLGQDPGTPPDMPPAPPDMPPPPPPPNGGLTPPTAPPQANAGAGMSTFGLLWTAASIAGTAGGAYHGYKRNKSIGWAIGWGLLGGLFPIIVLPLAAAQGFGKPKGSR